MNKADVLIIGAGLLGCFSARAMAACDVKTIVLEEREDVCTGISRANSGIIYPGYDHHPGSLKARLCTESSTEMEALCRELDVPIRRCGSLMTACGPRGEETLRRKYRQGIANHVPGLQLLSGEEALAMEPALTGRETLALYAPETASIDPWELGIAAAENAQAGGVSFHFREKVLKIERSGENFIVTTPQQTYQAKAVINCAGLSADALRSQIAPPSVRIVPDGADYIVLDKDLSYCPSHIIFEEREDGKGVTLVPTVHGNLLIGETTRPMPAGQEFDTEQSGLAELLESARRILPQIADSDVIRVFGAVRPNPHLAELKDGKWINTSGSIRDFEILNDDGMISLIGIKTPGLTCASLLGRHAARLAAAHLGNVRENPDFDPVRRGIPRIREMNLSDRLAFCRSDPHYSQVVCQCNEITEGEILEAIRRGAVTVDGVKRRVGTGMGRCQGSRCTQRIIELLADELELPVSGLRKDGPSSWMIREGNK